MKDNCSDTMKHDNYYYSDMMKDKWRDTMKDSCSDTMKHKKIL